MANIVPFRRPINWAVLRSEDALQIVRSRAGPENSGNVHFTEHAWERVSEREITRKDVIRILRTGWCDGEPKKNEKGNWQITIKRRLGGNREAGAVTVILEDEEVLIIRTVLWLDLK